MGDQAVCTVFGPAVCVAEIAAASFSQCVERTIAEQTVKAGRILRFMTGEKLAFRILKKGVMFSLRAGFGLSHLLTPCLNIFFFPV